MVSMIECNRIIEDLMARDVTRYRISKECGVAWRTIQVWRVGKSQIRQKNFDKLVEFYKKVTA